MYHVNVIEDRKVRTLESTTNIREAINTVNRKKLTSQEMIYISARSEQEINSTK